MIYKFREKYGWLSNMATCRVVVYGKTFESVENAYMYLKKPDDKEWGEFCMKNPPNKVKTASKDIEIRNDWEDVKLKVMYNLLIQKYTTEPFKTKLLETGNENIVEGNYWNDKFWGVDLKETPNIGENWLGRLIMDIRNKIRKGRI